MADNQAGGLKTFEQIVVTIGDYLGRTDLADQIPDFIHLVEKELERDIPLRDSEYIFTGTFTEAGDEFIELPKNLLQLRNVRVNTSGPYNLNVVSLDKLNNIRSNGSGDSLPTAMTMVGNKLFLAPTPTTGDTYTLTYRGSLAPLSGDNPTNKVLEDAPDCLIYGALSHSAPFIGDDERLPVWFQMFKRAKDSYRMLEFRNRTGGGPLHVRPDAVINDRHSFRGR
jgi:hypothetical protein